MHGGRIWVESEGVEGKGSTFTFLIPFLQSKAAPAPPVETLDSPDDTISPVAASSRLVDAARPSDTTAGRKPKTVLIIDDEPALLELLALTLAQKGFKVLQASNGRRGVELATGFLPDVIILDFTMPELGGTEVVEQLRSHPHTKDIPILINTGTVLNEEERLRLAGHVHAIAFKTDRASLLAELERLDATSPATAPLETIS